MKAATAHATSPAISTLVEGDPFLTRMQESHQLMVRRAYDLFLETGFSNLHDLEVWQQAVAEMLWQIPAKITEKDYEISMRAELPGLSEKDIEVKVDSQRVFITDKQEQSSEGNNDETVYPERRAKEILCECVLPAEIDPEKVTAELKDGVLDIRLPKCVLPKSVKSAETKAAGEAA